MRIDVFLQCKMNSYKAEYAASQVEDGSQGRAPILDCSNLLELLLGKFIESLMQNMQLK